MFYRTIMFLNISYAFYFSAKHSAAMSSKVLGSHELFLQLVGQAMKEALIPKDNSFFSFFYF